MIDALSSLKINKSPGDDGLTTEFYKYFWNDLSPIYLKVLREIKEKKSLCPSQKRGMIVLAFKKGEKEILGNYRPITCMNVDMKIITHALAKRIASVISNLISNTQKCVPGRQILKNLQLLQDLIDYINEKGDIGAAILLLDQEKAFDRMPHTFILKILRHFGFGEEIIDWIK